MNNLGAIDLNLLVVLDALLAERHVSRAAIRLNKSQPAVSHALARLRSLFDDPLLVRHGGQLEPTVRALEIAPRLTEALAHMRQLMGSEAFDPAREHHVFRLAMSDYAALVLLPQLMAVLRWQAPNVDLVVSQASREVMMSQAVDGEIDLALGVFPALAEDLRTSLLFKEHFACLADGASLGGEKTMDLSAYLERPHVLVSLRGDTGNEIDLALAAVGHKRRIALALPHWSAAPGLVIGTDLVLTVARRILPHDAEAGSLTIFAPPFAIPPFAFRQIWHRRRDGDPAHRWLRDLIGQILAPSEAVPATL
ncbi:MULTISPECIES: LysR family transcriptional regulator [unclassified Ensifer]|uniref:LysR family transcriptional regulator n=1 Tax=unclassified Ensifer TaxID=2633371 RepID=UPI0008132D39|nr:MULTISPECIES: LysR family transcriptional regulator [unclassified Ensifer]OCP11159.1 LysR family transcriptional regulator [Ensifer sp. LC14]OCP12669.1 LysR family transcriptional regulator [Ensifer sp. LC13]OCP13481.1 LysR family transcriptional regulator [Ensifer sp. LC11]OCP34112.1 LysR family transcriptional regulator [Ensifer sp. LC499]